MEKFSAALEISNENNHEFSMYSLWAKMLHLNHYEKKCCKKKAIAFSYIS